MTYEDDYYSTLDELTRREIALQVEEWVEKYGLDNVARVMEKTLERKRGERG